MGRRYTDAQLKQAVAEGTSIRQVLAALGLAPAGGNYSAIKERLQRLQIDISHFTGQGWKRGNATPVVPATPVAELLREGVRVQSYKLKRKLLAARLKEPKCENCGLERWLDGSIPLELDHINGDPLDNRLENLRIVCPNCHALTDTYRGKKLAKCRDETAPP
jgi:hypothetical protein